MTPSRVAWWLALGTIVVLAFALDGDLVEREARRALKGLRGGRA